MDDSDRHGFGEGQWFSPFQEETLERTNGDGDGEEDGEDGEDEPDEEDKDEGDEEDSGDDSCTQSLFNTCNTMSARLPTIFRRSYVLRSFQKSIKYVLLNSPSDDPPHQHHEIGQQQQR